MDRTEAQAIIDRVTCKISQYAAASHADAIAILGQETFERMMKDAVRKLGPAAGYVYPWNVVDYLYQPNLGQERLKAAPLSDGLRCSSPPLDPVMIRRRQLVRQPDAGVSDRPADEGA